VIEIPRVLPRRRRAAPIGNVERLVGFVAQDEDEEHGSRIPQEPGIGRIVGGVKRVRAGGRIELEAAPGVPHGGGSGKPRG